MQDEPAFCGLGTLVTALNALAVDPGRIWKGVRRFPAHLALNVTANQACGGGSTRIC